jgi:hypothetical protein
MFLLPLAPNSKQPLKGMDWHRRITDDPAEHSAWIARGWNVGFAVEENGTVVVDFDEKEAARDFYRNHKGLLSVIVETRRGVHFMFSGSTSTRKFEHGDLKGNGYTVFPPSTVDGWTYRFVQQGELQPFPEHLFSEERRTITRKKVRNLMEYLSRIESISGQNGSAGLVRAAAVCRDKGLSEAEAMVYMINWNNSTAVRPPWSLNELARAVHRVFEKGKVQC